MFNWLSTIWSHSFIMCPSSLHRKPYCFLVIFFLSPSLVLFFFLLSWIRGCLSSSFPMMVLLLIIIWRRWSFSVSRRHCWIRSWRLLLFFFLLGKRCILLLMSGWCFWQVFTRKIFFNMRAVRYPVFGWGCLSGNRYSQVPCTALLLGLVCFPCWLFASLKSNVVLTSKRLFFYIVFWAMSRFGKQKLDSFRIDSVTSLPVNKCDLCIFVELLVRTRPPKL